MSIMKDIKNIDNSISKVMKIGYRFALILSIFSTYILFLYTCNPISHFWFEIGILLLKLGLTVFASFFACGFVFDKVQKGA